MRVTSNTFPNTLINQLGQLSDRQSRLQNQAATGQRIQLPEDDPAAMRRFLGLQTEESSLVQYKNNIARLQEQSDTAYSAMKGLKKLSDRASEIATLADGTKSPEELRVYGAELTQIIQQAAQLANTKDQGAFLFGGTRTDQPPFVATLDAGGQVTSVDYKGNSSVAEAEVGKAAAISVQTVGANTDGNGPRGLITDSRSGADFFNHLISLQNNLMSGNTAAIANDNRPQLAKDEDNFLYQFGTIGAVQSRLQAADSLTADRDLHLQALESKEADADLSQTLVRLSETQNAYQAALQSGATILRDSLLNYLR